MISILDYGVGNLTAFRTIYRRLNIDVEVASSAAQVLEADHLILPGVGSFDTAMDKLNQSGMREALDQSVTEKGTPLLGVCVGMQMLANGSEEGELAGLGYVPGTVKHLSRAYVEKPPCLPHMGWNDVAPANDHPIWDGVDPELGFYFLHSYYFSVAENGLSFAGTTYEQQFTCAVNKGQVFGFQFHPEKSLSNGVKLLENFAKVGPC